MSEAEHSHHGHVHNDECELALSQLQAFLHGELPVSRADLIRAHLNACEKCLDEFDIEAAVAAAIKRCHQTPTASEALRMRVVTMSVSWRESGGH